MEAGDNVFGTCSEYIAAPEASGTAQLSWRHCAAEVVLTHAVSDWDQFVEAYARHAVSLGPNSDGNVLLWVWFYEVSRADNCFIFVLNRTDKAQLNWLRFLLHSGRLAIRNPGVSGALKICVTLGDEPLDYLRQAIDAA